MCTGNRNEIPFMISGEKDVILKMNLCSLLKGEKMELNKNEEKVFLNQFYLPKFITTYVTFQFQSSSLIKSQYIKSNHFLSMKISLIKFRYGRID